MEGGFVDAFEEGGGLGEGAAVGAYNALLFGEGVGADPTGGGQLVRRV